MVYAPLVLGALALLAPIANAAVVTSTKLSTTTKTVYATATKTMSITSTVVATMTSTKTVTQKATATAPVSTTTQTLPAQTVTATVTGPTSTKTETTTLPAQTVTETETLPAQTTTETVTASASTVTVAASASTVTVTTTKLMTTTVTAVPTTAAASTTTAVNTKATTTRTAVKATGTMGLQDYAAVSKRYLGTAVDIPGTGEASDAIYMAVANNTHEFGSRTPANIMKFMYTEPQQGVFDFTGGDYFVQMAHAAGINHIRCHALLWHQQLPYWLTSKSWDNATMTAIIKNHVTQLVTHFGDNCTHWDVVNEAFNDDGTWRQTPFYTAIGPSYVSIAFQAAQAAVEANGLNVKLYYNDYNIEGPGPKTNLAIQLVKDLKAAKVRIDGVGFQAHFIIDKTWYFPTQVDNLKLFTDLDVDVAYTELDVRAESMPPSSEVQLSQYNAYKWTVVACFKTPRCVGVTLWDFDDTYSWIPSTFKGQGYGCPWFRNETNNQMIKKVSYDGIIDGFNGVS